MTNNKQQTAVEWLQSIELERDLTLADWKKAKEMEKERLEKAYDTGNYDGHDACYGHGATYQNFDQYYEQTYGGGEQ
jgi:hypothetical protein